MVLGAHAVIPWNPKRQKQRDGLPPSWTAAELSKRTSIERFFGRVLVFFRLQRPPVFGWSAVETRVALTYSSVWVIALAAWQAGRPDLIRSPRLVLAQSGRVQKSEPPSWRSRRPWLASAVTIIAAGVTLGNLPHPSACGDCGDARVAWSGRTGEPSW